ncbi:MAG: hypothetical protein AB1689_05945 [Thermodesulfobacteriota bacterium]
MGLSTSSPGASLRWRLAGAAAVALLCVVSLAGPAAAQRFGGRGGLAGRGEGLRGGAAGGRFEGGAPGTGRFGGQFEQRFEEGHPTGGERSLERSEAAAGTSASGGDGASWETRNGGTVDASKTTEGSTTTRDVDYTGSSGQSGSHTGSVTKDDGSFSYSGSGSTGAGGSSSTSATGTYSDGRVQSLDTSVSGTNQAGVSGSHDGSFSRDGDGVQYHGSSSTSTGKWSDSAAQVTKTDDGFVAHGATANSQGAASGTVVKDGDQVYGRSVSTDGEEVTRSRTACVDGDCTRTSVTTTAPTVQQYYASPYYYHPQYYAYYACPPGSVSVVTGGAGAAVYSCGVTPVITTTIPLTAAMLVAAKSKQSHADSAATAQVTSSPVVMYRVASDTVVYATSYAPQGLYWQDVKDRYLWVPGAANGSSDVKTAIERAAGMTVPTANATVITYTIAGERVYLTNEAPIAGTFSERADVLYAWIPGVTRPTQAQKDVVATAVTAHQQAGAQALAGEVQKLQQGKPAPS